MEHPIRVLRLKRGLSVNQAAHQLAISAPSLSRIERGLHGISDPLKRRIIVWSNGKITASTLLNFRPERVA